MNKETTSIFNWA